MSHPGASRRPRRIPALVAAAVVSAVLASCGAPGGDPGGPVAGGSADPAASTVPVASPVPSAAAAAATETAAATASVPFVIVRDFRSTTTAVDRDDLRAALAGSGGYGALELVKADAPVMLAALGLDAVDAEHLILAKSAAALAKDLAKHRDRLGVLRATDVGPGVRALAWGKRSLFGVDRVRDLADWPLTADLPVRQGDSPFDPSDVWTMVAAGDVMLDRGVNREIVQRGRGIDFPFDGGSAKIVGRTCCSSFGWELPRTVRTGDTGAVRDLLAGADRSIVNLEGPAPDRASYHGEGTSFSFRQDLLGGLANAGIDIVSLANNHIGDAGRAGIVQTVAELDRIGIDHAGAGASARAARTPAVFTAGGVEVAVLGYDAIAPGYAAATKTPGSAVLSVHDYAADIRAARKAGADVVIVYPHWGVEYQAKATAAQRAWAHDMIDAGADLVIGNHAHWAAAMEVYRGKPIWYALGNFVFDQTWSEETEEGLVLELTFRGSSLVQARMHPIVILDSAQPNLLDARSGKVVMDRVYAGSGGLLRW